MNEATGTALTLTTADREALAQRVASAFAKLVDHADDIRQLWLEFENLSAGETIMGCTTKSQFCERVLGRSIRAVQYLLNGRTEPQPAREQCSPEPEAVECVDVPLVAIPPEVADAPEYKPAPGRKSRPTQSESDVMRLRKLFKDGILVQATTVSQGVKSTQGKFNLIGLTERQVRKIAKVLK